ncbi:hypothetical protein ACFQY8_00015 [Alloscardovia venturai]|uniref:Uncharacterized protein n=1 Tax=Alloscardovia venturai TaxID=1769421 RepID=A0ABW2Y567_9BIFI
MTDLQINYQTLYGLQSALVNIGSTIDGIAKVNVDHDGLGHEDVAQAMEDFLQGFEVHKHEFTKNAQKMADEAGNIAEAFQKLDQDMSHFDQEG